MVQGLSEWLPRGRAGRQALPRRHRGPARGRSKKDQGADPQGVKRRLLYGDRREDDRRRLLHDHQQPGDEQDRIDGRHAQNLRASAGPIKVSGKDQDEGPECDSGHGSEL